MGYEIVFNCRGRFTKEREHTWIVHAKAVPRASAGWDFTSAHATRLVCREVHAVGEIRKHCDEDSVFISDCKGFR